LEIDIWPSIAMVAVNLVSMALPWPHWVKTRAAVSFGCVRMLNDHVRQLFDLVDVATSLEIRG
jgi:lipoprotein-anchoring transpeptidase ErfK/SrfK